MVNLDFPPSLVAFTRRFSKCVQDAGGAEITSRVNEPCGKFAICYHSSTPECRTAPPGLSSCVVSQHSTHSSGSFSHMWAEITWHHGHLSSQLPSFSRAVQGLRGRCSGSCQCGPLPWGHSDQSFCAYSFFVLVSGDLEVQTFSCELYFPYPQV